MSLTIAVANIGKPAPSADRNRAFAAIAEFEYMA